MIDRIAFVDAGRTFDCSVETPSRAGADAWWWFRVSTDDNQRYAPFRAEADDTADGVRCRVVAYYENLLARRAEPSRGRWPRGGRRDTPATTTAPAPAAPAV
jgi:hypothetical protein